MKKVITLFAAIFLITALQAQVPRGTYIPKNEMAKASNFTKFEFTGGNKVKAYIGAMGVTVGAYDYIYSLNGNALSLSVAGENGSAEGFTYNKVTDEIALHAGAFGSEGAIWYKAGASTNNPAATNTTTPAKQVNPVSGKAPSGTYVPQPQNKAAEMSNFTKFEFTGGNKVKVYIGAMGVTVGAYDYIYSLNGNALSLMEAGKNGSVEGFTYDRLNDRILLHAGAFGTEGAIWHKEGKKYCDPIPAPQPNVIPERVNAGGKCTITWHPVECAKEYVLYYMFSKYDGSDKKEGRIDKIVKCEWTFDKVPDECGTLEMKVVAKDDYKEGTDAMDVSVPIITYNYELAKKCALYSALAYEDTRIRTKNSDLLRASLPGVSPDGSSPYKNDYKENPYWLENYKKLKDNNEIIYFTGKHDDLYMLELETPYKPYVLYAELKYNGYEGITPCNCYHDADEDNISYTFAYKKFNENDVGIVVILRGTDYVEWRGNMKVWEDKKTETIRHHSFQEANIKLQNAIKKYRDNTAALKNKNIHCLITGHSRGAAVANLLAVDLSNGKICGIKSVVAYTFATPNNRTDFNDKKYNNIFNFCFEDDFVPQVPLDTRFAGWEYGKSGENYYACAEDLYNKKVNGFDTLENKYIRLSWGREPKFSHQKTQNVLKAFYNIAPTVKDYYYTTPKLKMEPLHGASPTVIEKWLIGNGWNPFLVKTLISLWKAEEDKTLFEFMYDYIGTAAAEMWNCPSALIGSALKQLPFGNDVREIADYFIDGLVMAKNVNDTHQALTYYHALTSNGFIKKQ